MTLTNGKVPETPGETREKENLLERGCLLLVTMEQVLLLLETLQEHRTEYFPQLHPLLNAVELYHGPWTRHLFSPTNIPQLDGDGSFISKKGLDIRALTPIVAHLWQCMCQCSWYNPLAPIQLLYLHPTFDAYTTCPLLTPLSNTYQTAPTNPDPGPTSTCLLTTHIKPP